MTHTGKPNPRPGIAVRKELFLLFGCVIGLALLLLLGLQACARCKLAPPADLVLLHGTILTLDADHPEVEALAVRGDRIVAMGSSRAMSRSIGERTRVIDLKGLVAVPGFIEGHGHLLALGQSRMELDLTKARNWEAIVAMVQAAARNARPGEWILGSGWHQEKWDAPPAPAIEGYPTDDSLNRISPDNPVMLTHASGHALFANALARKLAGVTRTTPDPKGGRILRDGRGNPVGVFFDEAESFIARAHEASLAQRTPEQIEAHAREALRIAVQECLRKGITSFQDAASTFQDIDRYKKLVTENGLGLRLWVMIHEPNRELSENLTRYRMIGFGDDRLTVRAIKKFMDGALGSHTAWLLEPYSDLPDSTGLNVEPVSEIREAARLAIENGFQLCVHAIGDRANRETLNIYEAVFKEHPDLRDLRWRIEHAQHLSAADIPRFGQLGVIASMQAIHCTSDGPWVVKRLGARRAEEGAYVWQKLMRSGALVTNGTDTPVEDVDPIANFAAAVTRRLPDGTIFYPDQRMSRWEALKATTVNNAFAAFEEQIKGSLTPGKLADITVLSGNLLTVPEEEIRTIRVVTTIVGGKIAYRGGDGETR